MSCKRKHLKIENDFSVDNFDFPFDVVFHLAYIPIKTILYSTICSAPCQSIDLFCAVPFVPTKNVTIWNQFRLLTINFMSPQPINSISSLTFLLMTRCIALMKKYCDAFDNGSHSSPYMLWLNQQTKKRARVSPRALYAAITSVTPRGLEIARWRHKFVGSLISARKAIR